MSGTPPLTVAMSVYNGMPFVGESVRCILEQTFCDFEFLIGDDGSSDGSSDVLAEWARLDDRIRLLRRETKSGLARGANWVVSSARAPLVAIAHADDLSARSRLERQMRVFAREPDVHLVG